MEPPRNWILMAILGVVGGGILLSLAVYPFPIGTWGSLLLVVGLLAVGAFWLLLTEASS